MDQVTITTETTLRDYLRVLFRQKAVIITTFVTVMVTVALGLMLKTPVYESSVKLLISGEKQVEAPYYRDLIMGYRNVELALTQSEIVTSNPVIDRAVRATGLYQLPLDYEKSFCSPLRKIFVDIEVALFKRKLDKIPEDQRPSLLFRLATEDLKKNIKVEPVRDTNIFTIKVRNFSPIGAAIIANVVSRSYVIFDLEQQLAELELKYGEKHLSVTQLRDNIDNMKKSLSGQPMSDVDAIGPASVKIIEQAQMSLKPTGIPKPLTMLLAFFMSIFLSIMLAFGFEYMDQTFKSPREVETFLGLAFLGAALKQRSKASLLIKDTKKETGYTHFYATLAEQLFMMMKDKKLKSVLLASALPSEGTSTVIANLGLYLSHKGGNKVLLIDANLRRSSLGKILGIPNITGLSDVVEGKETFDKAVHDAGHKLHVLTAGHTELNPITLLELSKTADLFKHVKDRYDVILVDSPDLQNFKDAVILAAHTDSAAIVVSEGKTRRQVVKAAIAPLAEKGANLLGVILNNRVFSIPKMIYERI